jgi:hypothetical protein
MFILLKQCAIFQHKIYANLFLGFFQGRGQAIISGNCVAARLLPHIWKCFVWRVPGYKKLLAAA